MTTHWHLALSAEEPRHLRQFVASISTKHAMDFRAQTGTVGLGHVYQGRFCSVAVEGVVSYVRLIRYIEFNPVTAGLVLRAEDWRWSSLRERESGDCPIIQPGPWNLPSNWIDVVNTPETKIEQLPGLLGQIASFHPAPISFD